MGDVAVIRNRLLGLVCSIRCPGSIVIKTFDAIRELRDAAIVVAGGFHSPMEKECLEFLLRGDQPVVGCPAKGLSCARLPASWRSGVEEGRLLIISPFGDNIRRFQAPGPGPERVRRSNRFHGFDTVRSARREGRDHWPVHPTTRPAALHV